MSSSIHWQPHFDATLPNETLHINTFNKFEEGWSRTWSDLLSKFDAPGNGDMLLNSTFVLPVKSGRIPDHFSSNLLKRARMSIKRPKGVHRWAWPWLWHFTCWSCIHGFSRVFMQTLYSSEGNMTIPAYSMTPALTEQQMCMETESTP
jgi:hypothetical protein